MTTTTANPELREVDAAVRSVLAERFSTPRDRGIDGSVAREGDDRFSGRLLSLREAESLPEGLRALRVAPGTVVTPLARDYLKRFGIEVRFVARVEAERARNLGEWGFAIESRSGVLEAFRRAILDGAEPWRELGPSLDAAARWVAEAPARGALVVTDEASVAVYLGCQVPGVRAAAAEEPGAVARAVRALGVNLLVVESAGKSIALLKQMCGTFRRAGGPVAPDWAGPRPGRAER
jgi:hypothetical protein